MNKTIPSQDLKQKRLANIKWREEKLTFDPTCTKCGLTKTFADFPRNQVSYWCHTCVLDQRRLRDRANQAKLSDEEKRARQDAINARQNKRRAVRLGGLLPEELAAARSKINAENLARRNATRDKVYLAYGGYRCACCGETEKTFLSIDHVNNDGAQHRRESGLVTTEQIHRWIIRHNYPTNFQVLCMNCQWGKRLNNGVCPHVSGKV